MTAFDVDPSIIRSEGLRLAESSTKQPLSECPITSPSRVGMGDQDDVLPPSDLPTEQAGLPPPIIWKRHPTDQRHHLM